MFDSLKHFLDRHTDIIRLFIIVLAAGTFIYNLNIYTKKAEKTAKKISMKSRQIQQSSRELLQNSYRVKPLINSRYFDFLMNKINSAHNSIKILMFLARKSKYNQNQGPNLIFEALKNALSRGVKVKLLLSREGKINYRKADRHLELLNEFQSNYFEGYVYPGPEKLHGKLVIIDRRKALVGAHNWTWHSLKESLDTTLYVIGKKPLYKLHRKFKKLWRKTEKFYKRKQNDEAT